MKLSTRGRYAARAMLELAQSYNQEPVALRQVARKQQISVQYLEQLVIPLRVAGLLKSTRGSSGGFTLARPPEKIRIGDIIQAVEGSTAPVECVEHPQVCPRSDECLTRGVWEKAKEALDSVFDSITLQDLIDQKTEMMLPAGSMYHI